MTEPLFIFLFLLISFLSFKLLRSARIDFLQISIPSIFFGYYFLIAYMGLLPTYYGLNWYKYTYEAISDRQLLFRVSFYSGLSLIMILCGYLMASRFNVTAQASLKTPSCSLRPTASWCLSFLIAICAAVIYLFVRQFSGSALSTSLEGDSAASRILRSEMTNEFKGIGRYTAFYSSLLSFCTFAAMSQSFLKRTFLSWALSIGGLLLAIYASIISGEKAPLIWLILGCYLAYLYTFNKKIRAKTLLQLAIMAGAAVYILVLLFVGTEGREITDILGWLVSRIFLGSFVPAFYYLKMFPAFHDYLWGQSLPNPHDMFPWQHFRITVEVAEFMKEGVVSVDTVGSAPTTFWAELYANFGPLGPLIISPFVGIYIYAIHLMAQKLRPTPVKSAFVCWCSIHFMKLAQTGISDYLLDTDLILILIATALLLLADGQIRLSWRSTER